MIVAYEWFKLTASATQAYPEIATLQSGLTVLHAASAALRAPSCVAACQAVAAEIDVLNLSRL